MESEEEVRAFQPDFTRIAALEAMGLILSAPGKNVDFVSRFFAPRAGVPEDPVTGSAHCGLAPWWAAKLGRDELVGNQASPRGGTVGVKLQGDRCLLAGSAVTVWKGELV